MSGPKLNNQENNQCRTSLNLSLKIPALSVVIFSDLRSICLLQNVCVDATLPCVRTLLLSGNFRKNHLVGTQPIHGLCNAPYRVRTPGGDHRSTQSFHTVPSVAWLVRTTGINEHCSPTQNLSFLVLPTSVCKLQDSQRAFILHSHL